MTELCSQFHSLFFPFIYSFFLGGQGWCGGQRTSWGSWLSLSFRDQTQLVACQNATLPNGLSFWIVPFVSYLYEFLPSYHKLLLEKRLYPWAVLFLVPGPEWMQMTSVWWVAVLKGIPSSTFSLDPYMLLVSLVSEGPWARFLWLAYPRQETRGALHFYAALFCLELESRTVMGLDG